MSIDWTTIRSRWLGFQNLNRRLLDEAVRVAIPELLSAIQSLYVEHDRVVALAQNTLVSTSRQLGNIQTLLQSLEAQIGAALRALSVPGGYALYTLHDACTLQGVEYSSLWNGYMLKPIFSQNLFRQHPLSQPELRILYASGEASLEGDPTVLYGGTSDASVNITVRADEPVFLSSGSHWVPTTYRGGALVYLMWNMYQHASLNRIRLKFDQPVYLLGFFGESNNWRNSINLWADVYGTSSDWVAADGSSAQREYDSTTGRNELVLQPDTPQAVVSIPPQDIATPSGMEGALSDKFDACVYVVTLSFVAQEAPLDVTVTLYDDSGRSYVLQTQRVSLAGSLSEVATFIGHAPFLNRFGLRISVQRVGVRPGKLLIRQISVTDWLRVKYLDLPLQDTFDVPAALFTVPKTVGVILGIPHLRMSSHAPLEYFCSIRTFECGTTLFSSEGVMESPPIQQSSNPITSLRVFVEGENLESSEIVISPDNSWEKTISIPATQAAQTGGAEVAFIPYFGGSPTDLPANSLAVPLQYRVEQFSHGQQFSLRYVPYAHPTYLQKSLRLLGRYDPNLDLSSVDPQKLADYGISLGNENVETFDSLQGLGIAKVSDVWKGTLLGFDSVVELTDDKQWVRVRGEIAAAVTGSVYYQYPIDGIPGWQIGNTPIVAYVTGSFFGTTILTTTQATPAGDLVLTYYPSPTGSNTVVLDWDKVLVSGTEQTDSDQPRHAYDVLFEVLDSETQPFGGKGVIGPYGLSYYPTGTTAMNILGIAEAAGTSGDTVVVDYYQRSGSSWSKVGNRTLKNTLDQKALIIGGTSYGSSWHSMSLRFPNCRSVTSTSMDWNPDRYHYLYFLRGHYKITIQVSRPQDVSNRKDMPTKLKALYVYKFSPNHVNHERLLRIGEAVDVRGNKVWELSATNPSAVFSVQIDLDEPSYVRFDLVWEGDICVGFPVIESAYAPVEELSLTNSTLYRFRLPSVPSGSPIAIQVGKIDGTLGPNQRVKLSSLSASNVKVDSGGKPIIDKVLTFIGGKYVSMSDFQYENYESSTFTGPSWKVVGPTDSGPFSYFVFSLYGDGTSPEISVELPKVSGDNRPHITTIAAPYDPQAIKDPQTGLSWTGVQALDLPAERSIVIPVRVRGVETPLSARVEGADTTVVDLSTDLLNNMREAVVVISNRTGGSLSIDSIAIKAYTPVRSTSYSVALDAALHWNILDTMNLLKPIRVTVWSPYGTFVPDWLGELPISGTRLVENERLELASDVLLEQYEEAVLSGAVQRQISQSRPVYATQFAPIASSKSNPSVLDLSLFVYSRTTNSVVQQLSEREYVVDRERGLIQVLADIPEDSYLVATYRFKVVSAEQLRLYIERVRSNLMTRNLTDYVHGAIPSLKPLKFGADEVRGHSVLEYYHRGNQLILAQEVPPPVDAQFSVFVGYWYLPVEPVVRLELKPTSDGRVPIVRKLVVQV